ncbi:MAG TPA: glycine cleavage system aminomethyltransferase GcvT [Homoserinimonas sp.]|nr:glycine cleavage system aminomethyltransferase GcvT [Homoserinimonas sp.]
MTDNAVAPRFSPLHQVHVDAGASFTDFAGWQMPVRYSSELEEHHAVRNAAGIFDLSHMAEIIVMGIESAAFLDYALCGKISAIAIGQAKYSLLLSDEGGIIDDVIVYRTHEHRYGVVANAGNRFQAAGALASRSAAFDTTVVDESDSLALIAVQGPNSRAILEALPGLELPSELAELKYYWSILGRYDSGEILVARTGYTGEDGFELYVLAEQAETLWKNLMTVGADHGLVPAGLACRDTLRLEAGMPLYGHELNLDIFPAQAGLGRVVALKKESDFVGRAASEVGPPEGARVLVGLTSEGRRAGRADYPIFAGDAEGDAEVGIVTSGALSPTLGHPIAMAYVDPQLSELGTQLFIDVRGKRIPASVTALPFYKRKASE